MYRDVRKRFLFWSVMAALVVLPGCRLAPIVRELARAYLSARYKPKPLPADDDAFTARRLAEEELAFNRRTMVEIYQKEGRRNPAWDDRAVAFLDAFARYFACTPDCRLPARQGSGAGGRGVAGGRMR